MALNKKSKPGQRGLATPNIAALPPRKNSVGDFNPRGVVTGEFVEPPTVTDHTTRLFD